VGRGGGSGRGGGAVARERDEGGAPVASGHRGGVGMAGTGKRADHKKSLILNMKEKYFGSTGLKAKPKNYEVINVSDLERLANGKKELKITTFKILGNGEINIALTIQAHSASKVAIEKIKKAGGKVILENGNGSDKSNEAPSRG